MSNLFSRLFDRSQTSADGLTQPQREALIDLLNFCAYADDHLRLAEDQVVSEQLDHCQWDPAVPLELFVSRSVTRVRDALESPERRASFLVDVAVGLENSETRSRALALSRKLFQADGDYSADEVSVFGEIEKVFSLASK